MSGYDSERARGQDATGWRFADCELDLRLRELRRDGDAVAVEPRVLDLLAFLVERRDQAVSKDELLAAVWPGQVVSDAVFSQAIMKARKAVGDDGQRQALIRTVHGYGYRFAVDAFALAPTPVPDQVGPAPPTPAGTADDLGVGKPVAGHLSLQRRAAWFVLAVSLIAVLVWLWPEGSVGGRRPVVAMLPTVEASTLPESVVTGLQALLARDLSQQAGVDVIPAERVQRMLATLEVDLEQADDALLAELNRIMGADFLLRTHIDYVEDGYQARGRLTGRDGPVTEVKSDPGTIVAMATGVGRQLSRQVGSRWREHLPIAVLSQDDFANEAYARGLHALLTGDSGAAAALFESALSQDPALIWARYEFGNSLWLQQKFEQAEGIYREVLAHSAAAGEPALAGGAANQLGVLAWQGGNYDEAETWYREALVHYDAGDRGHGAASALGNLGILAENRGDLDLASDLYNRALSGFREAGDQIGESATYTNLAILLQLRGRLHEAHRQQERAVAIQRRLGLRSMLGLSLTNLAEIERDLGQVRDASELLAEARELAEERDDRAGLAGAELALARLALAQKRSAQALDWAQRASARYAEIENAINEIRALTVLAEIELERGDLAHSAQWLDQADDRDRGISKPRERALRRLLRARLHMASNEPAVAADLLQPLIASDDSGIAGRAQALQAGIAWQQGDSTHAVEQWRRALSLMDAVDEPQARADVQMQLATALIDLGEFDSANVLLTQVEDWNPHDASVRMQRARVHLEHGHPEEARTLLQRLREDTESWAEAQLDALLAEAAVAADPD